MYYPRIKNLCNYLTYAGSLPFVFCALCFVIEVQAVPLLGKVEEILSVYSLVIASFMAGSHWGQHLRLHNKRILYLPVSSNIQAVLLWLLYLLLPFKALLVVFSMSFLFLLFIDSKMFDAGVMTQDYFQTRCIVTCIVVITLILSGIYA